MIFYLCVFNFKKPCKSIPSISSINPDHPYINTKALIAFVYNEKGFVTTSVLLSSFFLTLFCDRLANIFLNIFLSNVTHSACDQHQTSLIRHIKKCLRESCSLSRYLQRMWHITCRFLQLIIYTSQKMQEAARISKTIWKITNKNQKRK